jgi:hypothetical protein
MAKTAIWGQTYKVLLDTGLLQNEFILDSSTLNGTNILDGTVDFADVTEYVLSVSIRRGRPDQLAPMPVGVATIILDDQASSRAFDPSNTASPYVESGYGIAPMRYAQIYGGTAGDEPLFVGRVRDLDIEYEQPKISRAVVSLVDDLAQLGRTNLKAFNPSSQLTSARVSAILDRPEVAYSTATRSITAGNFTCGTVAYDDNDNVKSAIDAVVIAEDGRFFVSRGGTATFQPTVDFTFGTAGISFSDAGGTAIPYQGSRNPLQQHPGWCSGSRPGDRIGFDIAVRVRCPDVEPERCTTRHPRSRYNARPELARQVQRPGVPLQRNQRRAQRPIGGERPGGLHPRDW